VGKEGTQRGRLVLVWIAGGLLLIAPSLTIAAEAKVSPLVQSLQAASSDTRLPQETIQRIGSPARRRQSQIADLTPDNMGASPAFQFNFFLCEGSCSVARTSSAHPPVKDLQSFLSTRRE
jgi:hypothetical protein